MKLCELLCIRVSDAVLEFKRALENMGKDDGYKSVRIYGKRESGVRKGQIQ